MKKKVGRPREFDRDAALQAAMYVFWEKGYDGASMKDLTKSMGINSPSLYSEFNDKKSLYLESIECYVSKDAYAPLVAFETEPDIKKAIELYIKTVVNHSTAHDSGAKGCFLSSCVSTTAGVVDGIDKLLQKSATEADKRIARRFELEKARGVLPHNFPSLERARLMFDLREGYVFRARSGVSATSMLSDIKFRVESILAPVRVRKLRVVLNHKYQRKLANV